MKFGGWKRETAPFVLTPEMVYVMTLGNEKNEGFQRYTELCCKAYNILRKKANIFISLFSLVNLEFLLQTKQS